MARVLQPPSMTLSASSITAPEALPKRAAARRTPTGSTARHSTTPLRSRPVRLHRPPHFAPFSTSLNTPSAPARTRLKPRVSISTRGARSSTTNSEEVFVVEDLAPLVEMDTRGFRRVRAGAEGVFKLVLNGAKWGGRCNRTGLERKGVVECLAVDPVGVRLAAARFGSASGAVIELAERVIDGGWSTRAMLEIERQALLRAMLHPD